MIRRITALSLLLFCIIMTVNATPNKYVELTISGEINEKRALYEFLFPSQMTVNQYVRTLERAAEDPEIGGVVLKISGPTIGWAKVMQIRSAVSEYRKSGKKIWALIDGQSVPGYLIGISCDKVIMAPSGALFLVGLRMEAFFFKDLLSKLGIEFDFLTAGEYKSAAEPFTRMSMSEESREMLNSILDEYYQEMISMIVEGRDLTTDTVISLIDGGPYTPLEAVSKGLVDSTGYAGELYEEIERDLPRYIEVVRDYGYKKPKTPEINFFSLFFGSGTPGEKTAAGRNIAYIVASGTIVEGKAEEYPFMEDIIASEDMIETIKECSENDDIISIILRIDSPGGSAVASDNIWAAVRDAVEEKPVIASLSDVAASGGYYIASAATVVIAEPGTLTGSIGVVMGKPVLKNLYEKIGVNVEVLSRGKNSGIFSLSSSFTESEEEALRETMEYTYDQFIERIVEGRQLKRSEVERSAKGRVWTGRQAYERGLVNRLGGIEDAVTEAKVLAGYSPTDEIELVVYPKQLGFVEFLQDMLGGPPAYRSGISLMDPSMISLISKEQVRWVMTLIPMMERGSVMAVMPWRLEIH